MSLPLTLPAFNESGREGIKEIGNQSILTMEEPVMRIGMKTWAFSAILAMGVVGCETGTTDTEAFDDTALTMDAAMVAADGMFQDLAHMEGPGTWAGIGFGPEAIGIQIQGSKSFNKTVTFYDAAGEKQSAYDPETTAKMHILSDLTREVTHTFWSADITRTRDMEVTGLAGPEPETQRTWNGTGTGDVDRSRHPEGGAVRTYDMESSAVITDVVRGVPRADHPYPVSGSITRTIHAVITTDGVEEVRDIVATITFDGDNTATMTVGADSWEIDLDDRGVRKMFQRKNP